VIIKDSLKIRRESVVEAERMIADQAAHFLRWLEGWTIVPTIAALYGHHDKLRATELERARTMLAALAPGDHQQIPARSAGGAQCRRGFRTRGAGRSAPARLSPSRTSRRHALAVQPGRLVLLAARLIQVRLIQIGTIGWRRPAEPDAAPLTLYHKKNRPEGRSAR
jgi:hypothetical protein